MDLRCVWICRSCKNVTQLIGPWDFESVYSCEQILQIKFMSTFCGIAHMWIPHNTFDNKSTLVQVMACCHQATSHYLSQCWPKSASVASLGRNKVCAEVDNKKSTPCFTGLHIYILLQIISHCVHRTSTHPSGAYLPKIMLWISNYIPQFSLWWNYSSIP